MFALPFVFLMPGALFGIVGAILCGSDANPGPGTSPIREPHSGRAPVCAARAIV